MVSFLFVSTLLERKALKLSKWACTRVTEWEEIRSVVSTHYTCALSFPQHQIRSCMFPDQQFTLGSGAYTYMKQYRVFREVPLLFKFINILSFLVITFLQHWKINSMTQYLRSCNFFYLFLCLTKTSSYKAKPRFCNRSFSLLWPATMQFAWNKRTFLHDKSPISKRFFGYANLTAILFCIWPPWSHVKTIDKVTLSGKHFLKLPKWTDWILPFLVLHLDEDQWNTV